MPFGDGTGPMGLGPMTGRAAGYCAGFPMPGYMNPMGRQFAAYPYAARMPIGPVAAGPYPPAMPYAAWPGFGPGYGRGFGSGLGYGRGMGFGRGYGRGAVFGRGRRRSW